MRKLLFALLVGLVGAGIVHIVVILLVPGFSERDAWTRLSDEGDIHRMVRLDGELADDLSFDGADPLFEAAACRFDLSEGVVQVKSSGRPPFWSASIYDRGGQNIYSLNDRSSPDRVTDFVLLTPAQMLEIRKALPEDFEKSVFIEIPAEEGIVVIRAFRPDPSWSTIVLDFLENLTCQPG